MTHQTFGVEGRAGANESHSSLSRYITLVKEIPELSREEEGELAGKWQRDGDRQAAAKLVNANLRYVVAIALKYRRYGLPLAELVAEGNFGVVHALRKFDPDRGTRFVTYAAYWIRAYILNHVIRSWSLVGVGSGALRSKMFFRLRRERVRIANLVGEGGCGGRAAGRTLRVRPAEKVLVDGAPARGARRLARHQGLRRRAARTLRRHARVARRAIQEEQVARERRAHPRFASAVRDALDELDQRERYIVESADDGRREDELSLAEIGRRLGVSRERARQLESRAKRSCGRSSLGVRQPHGGRARRLTEPSRPPKRPPLGTRATAVLCFAASQ